MSTDSERQDIGFVPGDVKYKWIAEGILIVIGSGGDLGRVRRLAMVCNNIAILDIAVLLPLAILHGDQGSKEPLRGFLVSGRRA